MPDASENTGEHLSYDPSKGAPTEAQFYSFSLKQQEMLIEKYGDLPAQYEWQNRWEHEQGKAAVAAERRRREEEHAELMQRDSSYAAAHELSHADAGLYSMTPEKIAQLAVAAGGRLEEATAGLPLDAQRFIAQYATGIEPAKAYDQNQFTVNLGGVERQVKFSDGVQQRITQQRIALAQLSGSDLGQGSIPPGAVSSD